MSGPDFDAPSQPTEELRAMDLSREDKRKVVSLMNELEGEFTLSRGKTLKDSLSGGMEDASNAHRFLFDKAVNEQDLVKQQDLVIAHLALDLKYNQSPRLKSLYGENKYLEMPGYDQKVLLKDVFPGFYYIEQMIADGSELIKGESGSGAFKLIISNEKLREEFLSFTALYKKLYHLIRDIDVPQGLIKREVAGVEACQILTREYFGIVDEHTVTRNEEKYKLDRKAGLDEFKSKDSGVCTEYAAFTHQMLSFAGLQPTFVSAGLTLLVSGNHAFEVISPLESQNIFIYDPSNPSFVREEQNPLMTRVKPYLVSLNEDQTRGFRNGEDIYFDDEGINRGYFISQPPFAMGRLS